VADGETGVLVPYDPAQATDPAYVKAFEATFAAAVNDLVRDKAKAEALGRAGRQRCIDHFDWAAIAQETVAVYEQAIAEFATR